MLIYSNVEIYTCLHSVTSVQFVGNHHHKHTDMYPSYFHKLHWNKYHLYENIHQYLENENPNMAHKWYEQEIILDSDTLFRYFMVLESGEHIYH